MSASRGIHVACFPFVFHSRLLAVPQIRHGFGGTPLFSAPERGMCRCGAGIVEGRMWKRMNMKRLAGFILVVLPFVGGGLWGDTAVIDGYTWTYCIVAGG